MLKHKLSSPSKSFVYLSEDIIESSKQRINSDHLGSSVIIPHVCNNINLFGAGFAAYIANRFPIVKENFHLLGNKAKLGHVQYITVLKNPSYRHELIVANMIAQNKTIAKNNPRPLNYEYLMKSMIDIRNTVAGLQNSSEKNIEIHCPKFGSGLAGGNWQFIENLISDIWYNIPVYVYNPKQ